MNADPWLDESELRRLTGYAHGKKQAAWLTEVGIKFHRNRLGTVIVLRSSLDGKKPEADDGDPFTLHLVR